MFGFILLHFIHDESSRNIVFNLCLSDLLPMNYECSARIFNENRGRQQRDETRTKSYDSDAKCERVSPAKRKTLKEKFAIAESYLGRFIANILKHFSDERRVQGVRLSYCHWLMEWIPCLDSRLHSNFCFYRFLNNFFACPLACSLAC